MHCKRNSYVLQKRNLKMVFYESGLAFCLLCSQGFSTTFFFEPANRALVSVECNWYDSYTHWEKGIESWGERRVSGYVLYERFQLSFTNLVCCLEVEKSNIRGEFFYVSPEKISGYEHHFSKEKILIPALYRFLVDDENPVAFAVATNFNFTFDEGGHVYKNIRLTNKVAKGIRVTLSEILRGDHRAWLRTHGFLTAYKDEGDDDFMVSGGPVGVWGLKYYFRPLLNGRYEFYKVAHHTMY